jgi:hypothetical protein
VPLNPNWPVRTRCAGLADHASTQNWAGRCLACSRLRCARPRAEVGCAASQRASQWLVGERPPYAWRTKYGPSARHLQDAAQRLVDALMLSPPIDQLSMLPSAKEVRQRLAAGSGTSCE